MKQLFAALVASAFLATAPAVASTPKAKTAHHTMAPAKKSKHTMHKTSAVAAPKTMKKSTKSKGKSSKMTSKSTMKKAK